MRKNLLILSLLIFFIPILQLRSQSKAEVEAVLKRMTPEQIDQKIKEMGLTREEIAKQAKERGLDFDTYLMNLFSQLEIIPSVKTEDKKEKFPTKTPRDTIEIVTPEKEDSIAGFTERIRLMKIEPVKPFGYNIFKYPAKTFEPVATVPTPSTYIVGAGDEISISVWGDMKLNHQLTVNREGNLVIPDVGPVYVNGLTIQQVREKLLNRMTEVYASLRGGKRGATSFLEVSLGKLRTIQVFVLGEVKKPGGYSLSSLSTILHALYLSNGPTINGSLRSINLIRGGKIVAQLDFYDYALKGNRSNDVTLQDGDVVFVPVVGKRVAIVGSVIRPAIYELKEGEKLSDLYNFCGGLQVDAYASRIHIERLSTPDKRKMIDSDILDIDISFNTAKDFQESNFTLENGDIIRVFSMTDYRVNRVVILGNVNKPGTYALTEGMRVKDLIMKADSFARNTFQERATLLRRLPNLRRKVIGFNPSKALLGDIVENLLLQNEDSIFIYKEQDLFPEHKTAIYGAVKEQGEYPRYEGMTVADLVMLAKGLREDANFEGWELARVDTSSIGSYSKTIRFNVNVNYWDDSVCNNLILKDFDIVVVPVNPKFSRPNYVIVGGYCAYPGYYILSSENERLTDIIERAGGIRPEAYLAGGQLFRKINDTLRLVPLDFVDILNNKESLGNIKLMPGDSLYIPRTTNVVQVSGEVLAPAAILYKKGASLAYYLEQAGGLKEDADAEKIVVTLPNGRIWKESWFFLPNPDISSGSTIYVPKKIEKEDKTLPIIRDWATIMASIATMMVAIIQVTR